MIKRFIALACLIILTGCAGPTPTTTVYIPPVFGARPEIIVIETVPDVYYVKGHVNIFFYSNWWYYYSDNGWYAGSSYNGPWGVIEAYQLPVRFGQIPPGHLRTPPGQAKPKPGHNKKSPPGHKKDNDDVGDGPPGHRKKGNR
ncbi:MAG: hypothetical protein AAB038_00540 [Planctomycetota bacterium]